MKLLCPCGNGYLIGNVTRKGKNFARPYYKCPGSDKENGIPDCTFYSFEDELKQCPCGRGYCRTVFPKGIKHWCCCVRGDGACSFFARIESTWQPPSSSTPPPHCQSPSSPSSPSSRAPTQFQSPPSGFTPLPHCQSHSSPSSRAPTRFQSSWSPSSSQGVLKKKNELLFQALQVSQSANVALVDVIKDFADFKLEDESAI